MPDQPELRHTDTGIARAMFRVAVSGRREQEVSFFTAIVWREQAEHAADSQSKGSRVVVVGPLQHRSWTAEDGSVRIASAAPREPLRVRLLERSAVIGPSEGFGGLVVDGDTSPRPGSNHHDHRL